MKKLWSIFTNNMNKCIVTGYEDPELTSYPKVERHHVFGGFNRSKCEKYGYIAPLFESYHPNGVKAPKNWQKLDLRLKQICQKDFEEKHGSREDFIEEFGRSYL
jgi:hypothetical protein